MSSLVSVTRTPSASLGLGLTPEGVRRTGQRLAGRSGASLGPSYLGQEAETGEALELVANLGNAARPHLKNEKS